jgi:hypothetical protein
MRADTAERRTEVRTRRCGFCADEFNSRMGDGIRDCPDDRDDEALG